MKNRKQGIALITILLIVSISAVTGGAYFFTPKSEKAVSTNNWEQGWKTHVNTASGYKIQYPPELDLSVESPLVTFSVPQSSIQGTSVVDARITVETATSTNCNLGEYKPITSISTNKLTFTGGITADAGAGSTYHKTLYMVSKNSTCYRLTQQW
jgi:hypothetical protein